MSLAAVIDFFKVSCGLMQWQYIMRIWMVKNSVPRKHHRVGLGSDEATKRLDLYETERQMK